MEYNDFELVSMAKEKSDEATNILYEKYKPIILGRANSFYGIVNHHGVELNDLIQEGYIGLDNAINNFREMDNVTFYTFASMCIERQIIAYIRKSSNKRQRLLNDAIAIDEGMEHLIRDNFDIENSLIDEENDKDIVDRLRNNLSDAERIVFDYKMCGYSISEIIKKTKKSSKVIYNTLDRIKLKFKKLIQDN